MISPSTTNQLLWQREKERKGDRAATRKEEKHKGKKILPWVLIPTSPCHSVPPPLPICTEPQQEALIFEPGKQARICYLHPLINSGVVKDGWGWSLKPQQQESGKRYPRKVFSLGPYLWRELWAGYFGTVPRATGHTPPLGTGTKRKQEVFRTEEPPYHTRTPKWASKSMSMLWQEHPGAASTPRHCTEQLWALTLLMGSLPRDNLISPGYLGFPNNLQQPSSHPQVAVWEGQHIY